MEYWRRQGRVLFEGTTNTGVLHRRLDTLVVYLGRHNQFPAGTYLMSGTGIVPPDDVALRSGDEVVTTPSTAKPASGGLFGG